MALTIIQLGAYANTSPSGIGGIILETIADIVPGDPVLVDITASLSKQDIPPGYIQDEVGNTYACDAQAKFSGELVASFSAVAEFGMAAGGKIWLDGSGHGSHTITAKVVRETA